MALKLYFYDNSECQVFFWKSRVSDTSSKHLFHGRAVKEG